MTPNRPDTLEYLEPGLRRVLACNPSPMTYWGTNTYIVGEGRVAIIDPGPAQTDHFDTIQSALSPGETIDAIFVTHSHLDHSMLARPLAELAGAPVLAFGDSQAGRRNRMKRLADNKGIGGGEGVDRTFKPDEILTDNQTVSCSDWSITALWTPGHFSNHMCFAWQDAVFSGDHIMGWASSLISPPDGDLAAFIKSTERLATREDRIYYPGHGAPVNDPQSRVNGLLAHRKSRSEEILAVLKTNPATIPEIAAQLYPNVEPLLARAAQRSVFAHLIDLVDKSGVIATPQLTPDAQFRLR